MGEVLAWGNVHQMTLVLDTMQRHGCPICARLGASWFQAMQAEHAGRAARTPTCRVRGREAEHGKGKPDGCRAVVDAGGHRVSRSQVHQA